MKKRTISVINIKGLKNISSAENILLREEQVKVKGGASPWLE